VHSPCQLARADIRAQTARSGVDPNRTLATYFCGGAKRISWRARYGRVRPQPEDEPDEATRVHHTARRRDGVAACGAGAAAEQSSADWVSRSYIALKSLGGSIPIRSSCRNINIEYRSAEGKYDRLPSLATELVYLGIDILVTYGTPGTRAAKQATTTIPIVMAISGDAIATGLIISLNRPGGNITGSTFFNPELCAKRLELIKKAVPSTTRVGVLTNPDNPIQLPCLQEMERTAKSINLELERFEVRSPIEFERAFLALDTKQVNAMTVIEDAMLIANAKAIVDFLTKRLLPWIAFKEIAEGGGLIAYGEILQRFSTEGHISWTGF